MNLDTINTHLSDSRAAMLVDAVDRLELSISAKKVPNVLFTKAKEIINLAVSEAVGGFNTINRHHMLYDVLVLGAWNLPAAHKEAVEEGDEKRTDFIAQMLPLHQLLQAAKPLIVKRSSSDPNAAVSASKRRGAMTCQCCARQVLAATGLIAHHGYRRPGEGFQSASCAGARVLPFEASRDQLGHLIAQLRDAEAAKTQVLRDVEAERCPVVLALPDRTKPIASNGRWHSRNVLVTRGNFDEVRLAGDVDIWIPDFESLKTRHVTAQRRHIDGLRLEIEMQSKRFEDWRQTHSWNAAGETWILIRR